MLVLFYTLCSLAPAAAFALGDGTRAAFCLTGDDDHGLHGARSHQHPAASTHTPANSASHDHGKKADAGKSDENGKSPDGKCCGLICVSALPACLTNGHLPDLPRAATIAPVERYAAGQPPGRLDRPPNTPLSL